MSSRIDRVSAKLDWFVPPGVVDPDQVRLARLIVACSFAIGAWGPPFFLFSLWVEAWHTGFYILTATVAVLAGPPLLRSTGSLAASMVLVLVALVWVLTGSAFHLGGPDSPSLFWLPILPLLAQMLGNRMGLFGMALTCGSFVAIGVLALLGVGFEHELQGTPARLYWLACGLSAGPVMWSLALVWDATNRRMRDEVERARAEAQSAHERARLVLDNVEQGLAIVGLDGTVRGEFSAAMPHLLGPIGPNDLIWEVIGRVDADVGGLVRLGWESLNDGFLPLDLVLAQFPARIRRGDRVFRLQFSAVAGTDPDRPEAMVVVVTDVTDLVVGERAERDHRQLLSAFLHLSHDPSGFRSFLSESDELVSEIWHGTDRVQVGRALHTLKGAAGLFGLEPVVEVVHTVELEIADRLGLPDDTQRARIVEAWSSLRERVRPLLEREAEVVPLSRKEYGRVLGAVQAGASGAWIAERMVAWDWDEVALRLDHFGEAATLLARRLDRADLEVRIDAGRLRTSPDALGPFWSVLAHVVRNAVDHGLETTDERAALGKPSEGRLELTARLEERLVVQVADDGRGIDWDRVRDRASAAGLPHRTREDLTEALFTDGLSTRDEVTETSGRGVGLGAVRQAVRRLGGRVVVASERGLGTTFRFELPAIYATGALRSLDEVEETEEMDLGEADEEVVVSGSLAL